MNQLSKTITISLTTLLILTLSACSTTRNTPHKNEFSYTHNCTEQGQPVTRFITAKVPLSLEDIKSLRQSLEEKFQLDHGSCEYIDAK